MRHGDALGIGGGALQRRLYQFNSRPATPAWRQRLADDSAVAAFLRADSPPRGLTHTLEPAWHYWRRGRRQARSGGGAPNLKLYVSPGIEGLPDALHATLKFLQSGSGMVAVKAARDVYGLMRPDSLVAYFTDAGALDAAASQLVQALAGMVPQGVPFTAEHGGATAPVLGRRPSRRRGEHRLERRQQLARVDHGAPRVEPYARSRPSNRAPRLGVRARPPVAGWRRSGNMDSLGLGGRRG